MSQREPAAPSVLVEDQERPLVWTGQEAGPVSEREDGKGPETSIDDEPWVPCPATAAAEVDHYQKHETFGHACTLDEGHLDWHRCACGFGWKIPPPPGRWVKVPAAGLVDLLVKSERMSRAMAYDFVAALPDAEPPEEPIPATPTGGG